MMDERQREEEELPTSAVFIDRGTRHLGHL